MSYAVASADKVDIGMNSVDENWKDEIIIDFVVDMSSRLNGQYLIGVYWLTVIFQIN